MQLQSEQNNQLKVKNMKFLLTYNANNFMIAVGFFAREKESPI